MSETEITADYPDLEAEDVSAAIRYAAEAVRERELPLTGNQLPPRRSTTSQRTLSDTAMISGSPVQSGACRRSAVATQ